jgi:hypothetical protein
MLWWELMDDMMGAIVDRSPTRTTEFLYWRAVFLPFLPILLGKGFLGVNYNIMYRITRHSVIMALQRRL